MNNEPPKPEREYHAGLAYHELEESKMKDTQCSLWEYDEEGAEPQAVGKYGQCLRCKDNATELTANGLCYWCAGVLIPTPPLAG